MTLDRCPLWVSQPVAGMARPSHPQSLPPSLHRHQSGCSEYCHCPTATPSSSQGKVQIPQLEELRPYAVRPRPALPSLPARRVPNFPVSAFASLSYPRVLVRTTSGLHTYPRGSPLSSAPLCTPSSPGSSWMRPYETLGPVWGGGAGCSRGGAVGGSSRPPSRCLQSGPLRLA